MFLALCFAALLALTVGTVALRANNRTARSELSELAAQRVVLRLEVQRRRMVGLRKETPEVLAQRLREFWEQHWRD